MSNQGVLFGSGSSAVISPDGLFRYTLTRGGSMCGDGVVNFVMLNPSTADAEQDDPTVRRCVGFARSLGFADMVITNIFALRATDPKQLRLAADPIGPDNDRVILEQARRSSLVIAAWGAHGKFLGRSAAVRRMLVEAGIRPHVLRLTKGGEPQHPLYLPGDLESVEWKVSS